jgi:hypothetical protein
MYNQINTTNFSNWKLFIQLLLHAVQDTKHSFQDPSRNLRKATKIWYIDTITQHNNQSKAGSRLAKHQRKRVLWLNCNVYQLDLPLVCKQNFM